MSSFRHFKVFNNFGVCTRNFTTTTTRQTRHEYDVFFRSYPTHKLPSDFVRVPIHHQNDRELLKTIVTGGNYKVENRNFWRRCASAVLQFIQCFDAPQLVKIINAFGKARYHDRFLFCTLAKQLLQHKSQWRTIDLGIVLNGFYESQCFHSGLLVACMQHIAENDPLSAGTAGLVLVFNSLKVVANHKNRPIFSPHAQGFTPEFMMNLDSISDIICTSIANFAVADLVRILGGMASIGYRNDHLLSSCGTLFHKNARNLSIYDALELGRSLQSLGYCDVLVATSVHAALSGVTFALPLGKIDCILRVLRWSIEFKNEYMDVICESMAKTVLQHHEQIPVALVFATCATLDELERSDVYLQHLCEQYRQHIIATSDWKSLHELMRTCVDHGLPVGPLADVILDTLESMHLYKNDMAPVATPNSSPQIPIEYQVEFLRHYCKLKHARGIVALTKAIYENIANLSGCLILHVDSLLQQYITDSTCGKSVTMRQAERSKVYLNSYEGIASRVVNEDDLQDRSDLKEQLSHVQHNFQNQVDSVTSNDRAQYLCHCDNVEYIYKLVSGLIGTSSQLDPEIMPALYRRLLDLSSKGILKQGPIEQLVIEVADAVVDGLDKLSTLSFNSLVSTAARQGFIDNKRLYKPLVLQLCKRIQASRDDAETSVLLKSGVLLVNERQDGCTLQMIGLICDVAKHLDLGMVPLLLHKFVKVGYRGESLLKLKSVITRALELETDVNRLVAMQNCCQILNIQIDPLIRPGDDF